MSARGRLVAWTAFVAVFAALNYASRFSGGSAPEDPLYRYGTAVAGFIQYAIVLGIVNSPAFQMTRADVSETTVAKGQ